MSKFLSLTRVLLKSGGDSLVQGNKKKLPKAIALIVLMIVAFIPLVAMFVGMAAGSYDVLAKYNQQGLILNLGISAASLIVFVFGILYVMSTFYFSMDIESLLPLPLKPSTIMGAKFTVVLIYEYATELIVLLPILITYGIKSGAGILYYIYSIIIFFTLPIIPLVIDAFINMIIMRFTGIAKNKDAFKTIAGICSMVFAIGLNVIMQKVGRTVGSKEQLAQMFMNGDTSVGSNVSKLFPSAKIAANSLIYSGGIKGLMNLIIFLVITIALFAILMVLGEALYLKEVIGLSQSSSKRKKLSRRELEEKTVQNSALWSYTLKELRVLFRTPAYFMNCVIVNFIFPIVILIPMLTQPDFGEAIAQAKKAFNTGSVSGIILAISLGVMMFICAGNPVAATSISREGSNIFVSKYMPISYKKQIMAKVLSGVILSFIGIILVVITFMVMVHPPVYLVILILITSIFINFLISFLGVLIDLNFPKLQWDNEQRAVKNNFNTVINLMLCLVLGGITIFGVVMLRLNIWMSFAGIVVVYGLIDIVLYIVISTIGVELFEKIEG